MKRSREGDAWVRGQLAAGRHPGLDPSERRMVALSVATATVVRAVGPAAGRGIDGLALGRQGHGRLERPDCNSPFHIFAPQQKLLLIGQWPVSALVKTDFFQKRIAAVPPKRLFRALLMDCVAQLVEMG
ncbi:MAG: hypothetical protein B7Y42_00300 [Polaromonas sp. 28-63-22]|nr:MAG: hypothetical protein B7Y42_00300 [Polaromonas sp. 28-63-22]